MKGLLKGISHSLSRLEKDYEGEVEDIKKRLGWNIRKTFLYEARPFFNKNSSIAFKIPK